MQKKLKIKKKSFHKMIQFVTSELNFVRTASKQSLFRRHVHAERPLGQDVI